MKKPLIILCICCIVKSEAQTSAFAGIDSLVQIGRYQIALHQLEKLPATFASNYKMASIYNAIDNHKKASFYYEKALRIKDDYVTKIKLGTSYRKQRKLQQAIQVFEEIIAKDPKNLLVQYQLGKLYLQTKRSKKAVTIFKNLIAKDSWNANYSYRLGLAYAQLNKRNLKINNFLNTFRKDSTHIRVIERLAINFLLLRDTDSSRLFIAKGLKINPNNVKLNRLKVNNLFRDKKYRKAIFLLQKLDSLQPNEHYTQKMLARAYYNLKDFEAAKKYFSKATKLDRTDFKSFTYLGHISFKEKDFSKAILQYMQATDVGKKRRDEEYFGLGQAFYEMKKPQEALKNFKRAIQESSKNIKALFGLAKLSDDYYKDKKIAYRLYKKYLNRFGGKDNQKDEFIQNRISDIKKKYFLKGNHLE